MATFKMIIEILVGLCAIIAIFLSIKSIHVSEKANLSAEKAISLTKSQFLQENRPYLEISPVKNKNGYYVELEEKKDACVITYEYKIENLGKGPATDIIPPQNLYLPKEMIEKGDSIGGFETFKNMSLAPGESKHLSIVNSAIPNKVSVKEYCDELRSEDKYNMFDFQIMYRSEISPVEIYSTKTKYKIYRDKAIIENYRHEKINDPEAIDIFNKLSRK